MDILPDSTEVKSIIEYNALYYYDFNDRYHF